MVNREPPSIDPVTQQPLVPPAAPRFADPKSADPKPADPKTLATIVHELRNPLSAFTSALHLLNAQPDHPDMVRQLTGMMMQQLGRFTQTVDELSALAANCKTFPSEKPGDESASGNPLPQLKILLVDDNQSATHMMGRLLEKLGQVVQVASSATSALDQIANFAPDFVISDIAMPGMSGYDLARRIRELDLPKRPYLVAVTGFGQEADRQEAFAAGFDQHLTKPIGVSALENLLRTNGS